MTEVIIAIVGSGALTTLITLFALRKNRGSERKKIEADAASTIGDAWANLVDPMERRIAALECEAGKKNERIGALECESEKKNERIKALEDALDKKDEMIKELQRRIEELEAAGLVKDITIQGQAVRINELESEVDTLKKQLEELGQNPRTKKK